MTRTCRSSRTVFDRSMHGSGGWRAASVEPVVAGRLGGEEPREHRLAAERTEIDDHLLIAPRAGDRDHATDTERLMRHHRAGDEPSRPVLDVEHRLVVVARALIELVPRQPALRWAPCAPLPARRRR